MQRIFNILLFHIRSLCYLCERTMKIINSKAHETESLIITSALLLAACGYTQAQSTQVIAHRGFWKTDGSAQNSIAALVKADSINCYGSEFDVWLTADNQLVVNHDSTFKGVNMQKSTAQQCTAVILDNGEQLPHPAAILGEGWTTEKRALFWN